jgi:hypothetical protein
MSQSETSDRSSDRRISHARLVAVAAVVVVFVIGAGAVLLFRDRGAGLGGTYPATTGSPYSFRYPADWVADAPTIEAGAVFVSPQGSPLMYRQAKLLGKPEALAVLGSEIDSKARVLMELQAGQDGTVAAPVPMQIDGRRATKWRVTLPGNDEGSGPEPFPRGGVLTGYQIDLGGGHSIHLLIESSESGVDEALFDSIATSIRFDEELLQEALTAVPSS